MWPDRRLTELVGIEYPIIQAPMVGPKGALAASVSCAGGLGSLACAVLTREQVVTEVEEIRKRTDNPFNLNFFCHIPPSADAREDVAWRARLRPYYEEFGLDPNAAVKAANRAPFDAAMCDLVVELRPRVTSFHFGLPESKFVDRLKGAGCLIFSSATTVAEARWLEARGADAIIAQGAEAGGHRGMFLTDAVESQVGTMALVPQVADAVSVPVIAAGGIGDARGIVAALALGAAAAQLGTAYLFCPEARISVPYRDALRSARDEDTALTNVFTGRPARGLKNRVMQDVGPLSPIAPPFPLAATALQPLRTAAEAQGSGDFSPLWSGQAASLGREIGAMELTTRLAIEAADAAQDLARRFGVAG
ncbi:NAD(P)H-dependent flavin oxidoreductase [Sinorhizobium fredii]|uniref:NAD(P)H-dependent flavin oxidoreductase n=1 Tax=Rhizobium fredii TaxID=380 RepID=UPI0004B4479A|nr:nitronate monooxygenase [Sinorhizobium fredii]